MCFKSFLCACLFIYFILTTLKGEKYNKILPSHLLPESGMMCFALAYINNMSACRSEV